MSNLITLKVLRKNKFAVIDLAVIEDPELSWKAKGLLAYLVSRPDGWKVWIRDLLARSSDGKSSLTSGITAVLLRE